MDKPRDNIKNKGGRPRKAVKKDQLLGVKCTLVERRAIEAKAKSVNLTVPEYFRQMGLTGRIDSRNIPLPKEVLQMQGTLNHLAANINQIAKKKNSNEPFDAIERAYAQQALGETIRLVRAMKTFYE
jgi:hypothetical protein